MKKSLIFTVGIILSVVSITLSACQQEVVEPEYKINGYYVLDDGSNLTDQYILFKDASVSVFKAQQKLVFIEDRIWNFNSKFSRLSTSNYSIQNGVLNSDIWKDTPIKLENVVLKLGEKTYSSWSGKAERDCYSTINVSPTRELSYSAQLDTIPYSIGKPIPSGHLTAVSRASWLTVENVIDDRIVVRLEENNSRVRRNCNLELNYDGGATATCLVTQKWAASSFNLTPESQNTDYAGGDYSFSFAIENPREGISVTAASQANWITDVTISGSNVNFKVAENNSGTQRSGHIRLTYGDYATADFTVIQNWSASSLILTPESQSINYTSEEYSFSFAIQNPRGGITVSAASQVNWITDVVISGSNVNFKVAENNSGTQRSGHIRLTYGNFAAVDFTVIQNSRPVTSLQLNKTTLVLYRGASNVSETLTATIIPSEANNTALSWSSSNPSVATVSSLGEVTGVARGTATITVTANDGNGAQATCEVEVKQYVTSISLNKTSLSLEIGDEVTLSVTILPDNANDKSYTWSSSDSSIASVDNSGKVTARANGNATIKATANDGSGVFASCSVVVFEEKVDMGIKTSDGKTLYWSTRNLCESGFVNSPEEYGDYYAWGETAPKENYSWSTYKFGTSSSGPFSKYNNSSSYGTVDNKTVLEPEDDVAHVKLGGKWRMPTDAEWTELRTKCTWTWVMNYNGSGINGRLVKATNGNSIFLPAAGRGTVLFGAGSFGSYWSSSLYTDGPDSAWFVFFDYDHVFRRSDEDRYNGHSVRPVSE